ncbi:MAG TPA: PepSY-associated TM helix domain-containing protein [Bacillus sp. (in: firmicutes)]|nr:PepSY-associated TM helix domain-containing protein [Bacillus sp. (in: firmicutes)]
MRFLYLFRIDGQFPLFEFLFSSYFHHSSLESCLKRIQGGTGMKKMRQAHLWIGLITSVFLLMEAITGILLTEPWLMGQESRHQPMVMQTAEQGQSSVDTTRQEQPASSGAVQGESAPDAALQQRNLEEREGFNRGDGGNSLMGIVKGLHAGRLGTMDIKWMIDVAAISMIFLTGSGIYLSVKLLAAQRKSRKKRALKVSEVQ